MKAYKQHTHTHTHTHTQRERERESNSDSTKLYVCCFIHELRVNILKITIDEFVYQTGWNNDKYYSKMVNGYKTKDGKKCYSCPTVNYLFSGIQNGITNHKNWSNNKKDIEKLIEKYFFTWKLK